MQKTDRDRRIARLEKLADQLDSRFSVFGIPVGWDALLGLIPGVGALITTVPTAAMIVEGARLGARKRVLARMAWNGGLDVAVGAIPILGDAFDMFFKSHRRNVALLRREADRMRSDESVILFEEFAARPRPTVSPEPPPSEEASTKKRSSI